MAQIKKNQKKGFTDQTEPTKAKLLPNYATKKNLTNFDWKTF